MILKVKTIIITVDININIICKVFTLLAAISLNNNEKFKNGIIDVSTELSTSIIETIRPGKTTIKVKGVKALRASLKLLALLATAIHNPLIRNEYAIITTTEYINPNKLIPNLAVSYKENKLLHITKDTKVNIKLNNPVIIDDNETFKNLPTIISLLEIGKVSKVSKVPLSFSPAVASVAG